MREHRVVLIGLVLVFLALLATYYLYTQERRHQEALREETFHRLDIETAGLGAQGSADLEVVLYFHQPDTSAPGHDLLISEKRSIFQTEDKILVARQIIHELIKGPVEEGLPIFSAQAELRQVYLLEDGTAVVDLSTEATRLSVGGVVPELSALRSITRSLIENIEEVKRVRFLVEGRERPTFAGHISIRQPFM
jgi:spore germination protein GerM